MKIIKKKLEEKHAFDNMDQDEIKTLLKKEMLKVVKKNQIIIWEGTYL
jgi:hypothetical protein